MTLRKRILAVVAPLALLAVGACTTGFPAKVARFQAMPAPQGQTFVIQAADPRNQNGLEFSLYADMVRRHLTALGYNEASSAQSATLLVSLAYGVDNGQTQIRSYPSTGFGPGWGWGPRYGYWRHPYYWGWDHPFYNDVESYTVFTSFLDLNIRRTADGQSVFEGVAKARSMNDDLPRLVPNLVEAMFTGFPGNSGETVKITVPPPPGNG